MPSKRTRCSPLWPVVAAGIAVLAAGGCTHTVVAPSEVNEPATVFLLDHGYTSSLVLPHDSGLTRYSYGDWDWYARNRSGVLRASGTLFSDSEAGIGRRVFAAEPTAAAVRRATSVPVEYAWAIRVPARRAARLEADLAALFRGQAEQALDNPVAGLTFVPHPEPYSLGNNSNHMTANWLRRLGCRVVTRGPFSRWRVEEAEAGTQAEEPGRRAYRVPGEM